MLLALFIIIIIIFFLHSFAIFAAVVMSVFPLKWPLIQVISIILSVDSNSRWTFLISDQLSDRLDTLSEIRTLRIHVKIIKHGDELCLLLLDPGVSDEFAGVYESLPPCCWSEDSQRVVFSSACRNRKVERLSWAAL